MIELKSGSRITIVPQTRTTLRYEAVSKKKLPFPNQTYCLNAIMDEWIVHIIFQLKFFHLTPIFQCII